MKNKYFDIEVLEFKKVLKILEEHIITSMGRSEADKIGPFESFDDLKLALAQTKDMMLILMDGGKPPFSGIKDCRKWIKGMIEGGRLPEAREMGDLLAFLNAITRIKMFIETHKIEREALGLLSEEFPDLEELRVALEDVLDERGNIHESANFRLASIRADIRQAKEDLEYVLKKILKNKKVVKYLQSNQVSWRSGRPVLHVKAEYMRKVSGLLHDRSHTGHTVFIEPEEAVEIANRIADLKAKEAAEIRRILSELTKKVAEKRNDILKAHDLIGKIDFLNAKAEFALKWDLSIPEIKNKWPLEVKDLRHPLLVYAKGGKERVVPLDLSLGDEYNCIVITGPNTGGKTVALKSVGLAALMANSGLPVFAERATIPHLDGVYADIGDEQEIAQNLSTFSSHMKKIIKILNEANSNCLVLLDELGAGTDPSEGGALGYAILAELTRKNIKVLASTHLGVLKTFAFHHPKAINGAMEFDPRSLKPLFRLTIGTPGSSNAFVISERLGLPKRILQEAEEIMDKPEDKEKMLIQKLEEARVVAEDYRKRAGDLKKEIEERLEKLKEKEDLLKHREEELEKEAGYKAERALAKAKEELLGVISPFFSGPEGMVRKAKELKEKIENLLSWSPIAEQRREFFSKLKKGVTVRIPRFRFRGPIEKIDKKKEIVVIRLQDGILMEVPFQDVYPDKELWEIF